MSAISSCFFDNLAAFSASYFSRRILRIRRPSHTITALFSAISFAKRSSSSLACFAPATSCAFSSICCSLSFASRASFATCEHLSLFLKGDSLGKELFLWSWNSSLLYCIFANRSASSITSSARSASSFSLSCPFQINQPCPAHQENPSISLKPKKPLIILSVLTKLLTIQK